MGDERKMQDGFEVRAVLEDELASVLEVSATAFGEELTAEDAAAWAHALPFERSLGAYENDRLVATSAVLSLELTLPGGNTLPMGGVTWISTLPTHRRRGLLRRLLEAHLSEMLSRGEAVSGLGASEGAIYGRFGYGPATSCTSFSVEQTHSAFGAGAAPPDPGSLTLLRGDEAATALPAIHDTLRRAVPGTVTRSPGLWKAHIADPPSEREGAGRMLHVVHNNEQGSPDGYASYRTKGDWQGFTSNNEVRVVELMAADPGCYAALWRYLLDTDLAKTISCIRGRVDEPLRWLLADPRQFRITELYDYQWLRLLDIPSALATRRYSAAGQVVFEVSDAFPTPSTKRYLLSAEPAPTSEPTQASKANPAAEATPAAFPCAAECALTERTADLALDAGTLASTYLGGVSFATLAAAGRVREVTPGAVVQADKMFLCPTAPFCSTDF